jgi:hypothetical protein
VSARACSLGPVSSSLEHVLSVRILEDGTTPASHAEAALWQNPDIESKLDNVCRELAKCSIHQDGKEMVAVIQKKLTKATAEQASLGSKGTHRRVEFNESSTNQDIGTPEGLINIFHVPHTYS